MTSAVVSKSSPVVVVGPSSPSPSPAAIVSLSSFDKFPLVPVAVLLVFDQPIDGPVETVKHALSRALLHYHPMAGRLAAGADGELHIACTGEGVLFVGASASCSLEEVITAAPPSPLLLEDLSVRYPAGHCRLGDALVMIQVTEFSCGGFVVGATWNHVVADGAGMGQFLQAVGELARGMPAPSVVPVRSGRSLRYPYYMPPPMPMMPVGDADEEEMASIDLTVSWSLIGRIKAECGGRCTAFDAVAAVLWRCRTRAVMSAGSDGDDTALVCFASNVRELVGARDGYYGNCLAVQFAGSSAGTVARSDIRDLVRLIRLAKEKVPELLNDGMASGGGGGADQEPPQKQYNVLGLTSWRNIGLDTVDMGRGKPARVMSQPEKKAGLICVLCLPCKGKHGVNVLSRCVRPEHAGGFLAELAAVHHL